MRHALVQRSRTITVIRNGTSQTEHHLRFGSNLEFWNVMEVLSRLRSEEETRLDDLMTRLRHVRTTVPVHSADPANDAWCQNPAHTTGISLCTDAVILLLTRLSFS